MRAATRRMVIVGGSLAGLSAASSARAAGWTGALSIVCAEEHRLYNRPPLSKQVLLGELSADATALPLDPALDADWRLGVFATGLDLAAREVELGDGTRLSYDRLLIATGAEARGWPKPDQAGLGNVHVLRSLDHAVALRAALVAAPRRVLVVGGGFIACEVASSCRALGIEVAMATPAATPLESVLGARIGAAATALHEGAGVQLVTGERIVDLVGDPSGRVAMARTEAGREIEADLVVLALGAVRNIAWLADAGLSADEGGLDCDGDGRALDRAGATVPDVFAAGDVARFPHPLRGGDRIVLEHWGHAVAHGAHVGRVMAGVDASNPYDALPAFWSTQHGVNIKSVGLTAGADAVTIVRGDLASCRFVAVYGRQGRCVAAVSFDSARWLPLYAVMIRERAEYPPAPGGTDEPKHEASTSAFEERAT